eukprot:GFUD01011459.1.p1 GENE.GFUD01011459.1~~GFUD01011459.1.p1  ORF type:complete len:259 (+),score=57.48 GFUD01011459.1:59-835(+)
MKVFLLLLSVAALSCGQGPPSEPPAGQRCSGRNYEGRRCCTPEQPCGLGEGDCDGPLDGGVNDGHAGCQGDLVCGSNNCKKFGLYFHEKDDCCDEPSSIPAVRPPPVIVPGAPLEPPTGQRCRGRNYDGRRCCTPEQPCGEGEGDCDGRGDGGLNDGDRGCRGALVCGSNNCAQFGAYYHEKDDCCEKPATVSAANPGPRQQTKGWGQWTQWGPCSASCGAGWKVRTRKCVGSKCGSAGFHAQDRQERICIAPDCNEV